MRKIRKAVIIGLAAGMSLSFAPVHLFGWGDTWMGSALELAVNAAHSRLGPLMYDAAFLIDHAGHATDIYYGSTPNAVPDFTFTTGPSLHLLLPVEKKVVFDFYELPQYVFFLDTKGQRTLNNTFAGLVHFVLDKFYFQAGGGLIDVKERLSTELNINVRRKEDALNGLALWQISKGASLALQFRRTTFNYENFTPEFTPEVGNIGQQLDRTETYINVKTYLEQHARLRFYLDGEYGSYEFTDPASSFKNSRSYSIFGGVDFLPPAGGYEGQTSGVRGSINLGYKSMDFLNPLQRGYSGLAGNTAVSWGIIKLTAIHAFFSREPQFSVYSGVAYYLRTTYGAGLSRSITKKILFTYDFFYARNDYPSTAASGGSLLQNEVDRYTTHSFRLNFGLMKDLEFSLLADLGRRNSKIALRPVSRNDFIGFSLIYGYPSGVLSLPARPLS